MSYRNETTELQWFREETFKCRQCGKPAAGTLMSRRNESYGLHCKKCATSRLKASKAARESERNEVSA